MFSSLLSLKNKNFYNLSFWFPFFPIFSGDTDAVVPVTATRYSIDALKLPTITNWYAWNDNGKVLNIYLQV